MQQHLFVGKTLNVRLLMTQNGEHTILLNMTADLPADRVAGRCEQHENE